MRPKRQESREPVLAAGSEQAPLEEANNMRGEYRHLLVRLQMEKDKLLGWAVLARVSESEQSFHHTLRLSRHTIHDAFRGMQIVLLDTSKPSISVVCRTSQTTPGQRAMRMTGFKAYKPFNRDR